MIYAQGSLQAEMLRLFFIIKFIYLSQKSHIQSKPNIFKKEDFYGTAGFIHKRADILS